MPWSRSTTLLLIVTAALPCGAQSTSSGQSSYDKFEQMIRGDSGQQATPAPTRQPDRPSGQPPAQRNAQRSTLPTDNTHYVMRWAKLIDQSGFDRPMEAGSALIPSDWKWEGQVKWGPPTGCTTNLMTTMGRATSPDGLSGFEYFPTYAWVWSDDPQARQIQTQAAAQQPESMKPCEMAQLLSPVDYIRSAILPRMRPNARVVSAGMLPELTRAAQSKLESDDAQFLQMRVFTGVRAQVGEVKITYQINGQPVEETIMAQIDVAVQQQPSVAGLSQGAMNNVNFYNIMAERLFAIRAPAGQLAARADLYSTMLASLRQNQQWLTASQQVLSNIMGVQQQGNADRQQIMYGAQQEQGNAIIAHGQEVAVMEDRNAAEFSQAQREVEWYTDPNTNDRMELSAGYAHSWTNGNGEVILNDDPNYNPSRVYQGNWTQLQRNR
jgi:hypothetical protein